MKTSTLIPAEKNPVRIEVASGIVTTTSLDVAAHFKKRHDNVLAAIKALDCSPEFRLLNFKEASQQVRQPNGGTAKYPFYRMTRDGFSFLCMGFTGKAAAIWKEAYIVAFNRMEQALLNSQHPQVRPASRVLDVPHVNAHALEFARLTIESLPGLGESSKQVLLSNASELAFGRRMLPLPKVEESLLSATDIAKQLGVSAQKIGRIANQYGLKTPEYGESRLNKALHCDRMVETFHYNQQAVSRITDLVRGDV